jgi:hypothetical protein
MSVACYKKAVSRGSKSQIYRKVNDILSYCILFLMARLLYAISGKGMYGQDSQAQYGAASSRAVNHRIIQESARQADSCRQSVEIPF